MASEVGAGIGASTLLAAGHAAVYVAQIEDGRMTGALAAARYLDVTRRYADMAGCGSMTGCS
jgi:hypothetical protein